MKKLLLLLFLSLPVFGQGGFGGAGSPNIRHVTSDPTGVTCDATKNPTLEYQSRLYRCRGGKYYEIDNVTAYAENAKPTCDASVVNSEILITNKIRGQRKCKEVSSGVYAWVNPNPWLNVLEYGVDNTGTTTTATRLSAALAEAVSGDTIYFPRGTYDTGNSTFTWPAGVNAQFEDTIISSTATSGIFLTINSAAKWWGNVTIKRATSSSTNSVTLLNVIGASGVSLGNTRLENAHLGLVIQNSSKVEVGKVSGNDIDGQYVGGSPGGDLLGIIDCQNVTIGDVSGTDIAKVGVYFSVDDSLVDTENVQVGNVNIKNKASKCCGAAVSIRHGNGVTIGDVVSDGGYRGVLIQSESGDLAPLKNISIGNIVTRNNSVSGGVGFVSYAGNGITIKNVHIGNVTVDTANQGGIQAQYLENFSFGAITVRNTSADFGGIQFSNCINGNTRDSYTESTQTFGVQVTNSTNLHMGNIYVKNNSRSGVSADGVRVANCTYFTAEDVTVETTSGTGHAAIFQQTSATNTNKIRSAKSIGTTTDGTIYLNGTNFLSVRNWRLFRNSAPSTGTWAAGDTIYYNSISATDDPIFWVCRTAGTPGTWMAVSNTPSLQGTVTIDLPSIPANTTSVFSVSISGAATGNRVILNPPAAGLTSGLILHQVQVQATNTIYFTVENVTGNAINEASGSWSYAIFQ